MYYESCLKNACCSHIVQDYRDSKYIIVLGELISMALLHRHFDFKFKTRMKPSFNQTFVHCLLPVISTAFSI